MTKTVRLSPAEVGKIVGLLTRWEGKLTWELLLEKVRLHLGKAVSRQALDKREKVRLAFQETKERLRRGRKRRTSTAIPQHATREMAAQQARVDRFQAEITVLKRENAALFEQFAVWLYNARSRGIMEKDLNAALPRIDRGWTGPRQSP